MHGKRQYGNCGLRCFPCFLQVPRGGGMDGSRTCGSAEQPLHRVRISNDFWMGKTPVTQEQWRVVMGGMTESDYRWLLQRVVVPPRGVDPPPSIEVPSRFKGDRLPVESANWYDALVFCQRLQDLGFVAEGWKARLPTEAEWEYACRAGSEADYALGDGEGALSRAGWFVGNSEDATRPVGLKEANRWGLCDTHGDVWEWCWDAWEEHAYARRGDPAVDPTVLGGTVAPRVRRGGGWLSGAHWCRSMYRGQQPPGDRSIFVGLRVCLVRGSVWRRPDELDLAEGTSRGDGAPGDAHESGEPGPSGAVDAE